jgi:hypothetical protein
MQKYNYLELYKLCKTQEATLTKQDKASDQIQLHSKGNYKH